MNGKLRVVGIGGSLAVDSTSLAALKVALAAVEEAGAETTLFDIRTMNLPMYHVEARVPPAAEQLAEAAFAAQALIWSSPLYHGTVSGSFKNALDWLHLLSKYDPPYLTDKVIGLISTAGGTQGLQAINTMEFAVRALRGWAVPLVLPIPRASDVFDDGRPQDELVRNQLRLLGQEVVRAATQMSAEGYCDYAEPYFTQGLHPSS